MGAHLSQENSSTESNSKRSSFKRKFSRTLTMRKNTEPSKPAVLDVNDSPDADQSKKEILHKNITDIIINDATLERFLEVQLLIEEYDNQGIFEQLAAAEEEFEIIAKNFQKAQINFTLLSEQCKKEKKDFENISLPTVQSYFKNKKDHDKAISKEQHEYLQSLNLVEIAENELKAITQQYNHSKEKLHEYKMKHQKAIQLYNEQMDILYSTYEGDYGSEYENRLEKEVNVLAEQKEILRSALNKWRNVSFLLVYAYNQIFYSEQRWKDMMNEPNTKYPEKVISATEVRNNLVAAYQNLLNTKAYLKNIDFPYCNETDLKTLQTLASRTYYDMQSSDKQRYCLTIIQILRKRCASLNQWFEQVITTILVVDYTEIKVEFDQKSKELKMERIRLLREKIKEKSGTNIDINSFSNAFERLLFFLVRTVFLMFLLIKGIYLGKRKSFTPEMANEILNSSFIIGNDKTGMNSRTISEICLPQMNQKLMPMPTKEQILGDTTQIMRKYRMIVKEGQLKKKINLQRKCSV